MASVRRQAYLSKQTLLSTLNRQKDIEVLPTHPTVSILTIGSRSGRNLLEEMEQLGIWVEPGSAFQTTHSGWSDRYCRLRLPIPSKMEELCRRLQRISLA